MSEALFGNYLASVMERDIDLMLMEEFHVSPDFVNWFGRKAGLKSADPLGAWHSLCTVDGETDLLLVIKVEAERVGLFIENKIGAGEQEAQDVRYHKRGREAVQGGKIDSYVTAICAPADYLNNLPKDSQYQHRISYEEIAAWYEEDGDRRAQWRAAIFREAIEQRRRGSVMIQNSHTTAFHNDFWQYLTSHHPSFFMNKPSVKGSKSNWIIVKKVEFPKGVKVHFKFDQGVVELGFQGHSVEDFEHISIRIPDNIYRAQKGKTAALGLPIPAINVLEPLAGQREAIEEAIVVAHSLSSYAKIFGN